MLCRILLIVLVLCAEAIVVDAAPPRTVKKVRNEQQVAKKRINENTRKLNANAKETQRNLNELNVLNAEISVKNREISSVKAHIDSIDTGIRRATDSLSVLNAELEVLQEAYIKSLRSLQGTQPVMNSLGFVFSSKSFGKAYARMRYIKEFARWRKRKALAIISAKNRISDQRHHLDSLNTQKRGSLAELSSRQSELREQQRKTDRVVKVLKQERSKIQAAIQNQKKQMQQLENELKRLEREDAERKKREAAKAKASKSKTERNSKGGSSSAGQVSGVAAADRKLTGGFERNKGRLLMPVSGKYTVARAFGTTRHPEINNIETQNTGIDILVSPGTKARCIYDGEVSAVMWQSKGIATVLIRHGDYRSVYQFVLSPVVKTGDKVKTNQIIGTVAPHVDYSKRPVLHFEIRKRRTPLSPLQWVK